MALVSPVTTGDVLDELIAMQEAMFLARTRRSHELHLEASAHLPGGVASSWQDAPPRPVFLERGQGSREGGGGVLPRAHPRPARPCRAQGFVSPIPTSVGGNGDTDQRHCCSRRPDLDRSDQAVVTSGRRRAVSTRTPGPIVDETVILRR